MAKRSLLPFFAASTTANGAPSVAASGESCRYECLQVSKRFFLPPGFHDLDVEIELAEGGVTVGLLDTRGAWRSSINISRSGRYQLRVVTFGLASLTRVVIAACNVHAPGSVRAVISRLTLDSWLFRPEALGSELRHATRRFIGSIRTVLIPSIYRAGIRRMAGSREVLVAQWGGDPTDLNASGRGSFVALPIGENGQLREARRVDAGTNPTTKGAWP